MAAEHAFGSPPLVEAARGGGSGAAGPARISVVIPALNEAARIEQTLTALPFDGSPLDVLVVDGGSADRTVEVAARHAQVIRAERGRARQMNAGAARAKGDILLFLHADTVLPSGAFAAVRAALADPSAEAGAFRLRFDEATPVLRFYGFCTRLPVPRLCFGDRALFVRRTAFEAVGGYPDLPIFEDIEIVRALHRRGGFRFLDVPVTTSARRFVERGTVRQQLLNTRLWLHYLLGGDPHRMARHYRYPSPPVR